MREELRLGRKLWNYESRHAPRQTSAPGVPCGRASRRAARGRGSLGAAAMAEQRGASDPPADVDGDDCLAEYRHLFSPDILA